MVIKRKAGTKPGKQVKKEQRLRILGSTLERQSCVVETMIPKLVISDLIPQPKAAKVKDLLSC